MKKKKQKCRRKRRTEPAMCNEDDREVFGLQLVGCWARARLGETKDKHADAANVMLHIRHVESEVA